MMKYENEWIIEICKFIAPDKDKLESLMGKSLDYPYILGQLLYNRMGGAAFYSLEKCGLLGKTNREFRNTLKTVYESNRIKTQSFGHVLNTLSKYLSEADFPYAILKGGYLAGLYPQGLRTSNDIDFLIDGQDVSRLSALLKSNGFMQGNVRGGQFVPATRAEILSSRMNRGETVPFIKKVDLPGMEFCEIDINFSLDFKAKQASDTVARLLGNAKDHIITRDGRLYTLSEADFLIHLCVHLFKEATVIDWVNMGRDLSIYKFADIYLFISVFMSDDLCRTLSALIDDYQLNRECYYAFLRTKELYGIQNNLLDRLLEKIKPPDLSYLNEIIHPASGKIYRYDAKFTDWLFCSHRKEQLYEA